MQGRSLKISESWKAEALKALTGNCLTQKALAGELGISRQPVNNFFKGEPVDRQIFVQICERLGLEWDEVVAKPFRQPQPEDNKQNKDFDIDALVQQVRQKRHAKIQEQCGKMRMLDIEQPIDTTEIYTDVNILEKITSRQWREIPDLLQNFNPESDNFDRLGLGRVQKRVPGLEAVERYSKLMVLGKPGAGKTTFLKWLAVKCNLGEFQPHLIPIFISLKDFAKNSRTETEFNLFNYIKNEEFRYCGITNESVTETLLMQYRFLILLDGLDEVSEADEDEVIDEIRKFGKRYFQNHFIITCRIAAAKYRFQEENFTEVEVADFNYEQVKTFVKKWFIAVANNNQKEGEATARKFLHNLKENQQMRELSVTPILLNLTCLVFREKGEFTSKRSKLYEEGLNILLVRWDECRGIKRDEFYRNLSIEQKIKLLSQIASITFDKSSYFFEQREVERYIAEYLCSLSNAQTDRSTLQRDSEAVLKSIEAQHGLLVERAKKIYSFYHLTFQEYFTTRAVINSFEPQALKKLVSRVTNKSWREVFMLAAEMMQNSDELLLSMKQKIDLILASDHKLQEFLRWVSQKSLSVEVSYKPAAVRAFYFYRSLAMIPPFRRHLVINLDRNFAVVYKDIPYGLVNLNSSLDSNLDLHLDRTLSLTLESRLELGYIPGDQVEFYLKCACAFAFNPDLKQALEQLKYKLPDQDKDIEKIQNRYQTKGQAWTEQLRDLMIEHRNIGHDWLLNEQQKELLNQYYDANELLVDCLNNCRYVSREIRQEIEDTLLLPIAEIEKHQQRIS